MQVLLLAIYITQNKSTQNVAAGHSSYLTSDVGTGTYFISHYFAIY